MVDSAATFPAEDASGPRKFTFLVAFSRSVARSGRGELPNCKQRHSNRRNVLTTLRPQTSSPSTNTQQLVIPICSAVVVKGGHAPRRQEGSAWWSQGTSPVHNGQGGTAALTGHARNNTTRAVSGKRKTRCGVQAAYHSIRFRVRVLLVLAKPKRWRGRLPADHNPWHKRLNRNRKTPATRFMATHVESGCLEENPTSSYEPGDGELPRSTTLQAWSRHK